MERPALKKDWVLTREALETLLCRLDPDPERAGQHYQNIRRALVTFFECRGSVCPEDHADDTIDRVARRLLEGKQIYAGNPADYFYGVARNVLKEQWSAPGAARERHGSPPTPIEDPEESRERMSERRRDDQRLECLERCLQELSTNDRELIVAYYQGETSGKIQNRKALAERLNIPLNALRIRALRIREKLEACVAGCLGERPEP